MKKRFSIILCDTIWLVSKRVSWLGALPKPAANLVGQQFTTFSRTNPLDPSHSKSSSHLELHLASSMASPHESSIINCRYLMELAWWRANLHRRLPIANCQLPTEPTFRGLVSSLSSGPVISELAKQACTIAASSIRIHSTRCRAQVVCLAVGRLTVTSLVLLDQLSKLSAQATNETMQLVYCGCSISLILALILLILVLFYRDEATARVNLANGYEISREFPHPINPINPRPHNLKGWWPQGSWSHHLLS